GCWVAPTVGDSVQADSSRAGCSGPEPVVRGLAAKVLHRGARWLADSQDGSPAHLPADWQAGSSPSQVCPEAPALPAEPLAPDAASASPGGQPAGPDAPVTPALWQRMKAAAGEAWPWR